MAEALSPRLCSVALAAAVLLAAPAAPAAGLTDPTTPATAPAASAAAPSEGTATPSPAALKLQMIVRGPGESRVAVIDGERVRVGDRLPGAQGDVRVARIDDFSVVLVRAGLRETLHLLPSLKPAATGSTHARTDAR